MNWTDADKRMLAQYLAELNGGRVVYVPRPIIGPLLDWAGTVLHRALFTSGTNSRGPSGPSRRGS